VYIFVLQLHMFKRGNWSSIVDMVTDLWAGRSGVRIPVGAGDSSLLENVQTGCGAYAAILMNGYGVNFQGVE
jgi:hypothetical protein